MATGGVASGNPSQFSNAPDPEIQRMNARLSSLATDKTMKAGMAGTGAAMTTGMQGQLSAMGGMSDRMDTRDEAIAQIPNISAAQENAKNTEDFIADGVNQTANNAGLDRNFIKELILENRAIIIASAGNPEELIANIQRMMGMGRDEPGQVNKFFEHLMGGQQLNLQPNAGFAKGGPVGTDTVPAMLTPGEFVMKKSAVDKYGTGFMRGINGGSVQYREEGGIVPSESGDHNQASEKKFIMENFGLSEKQYQEVIAAKATYQRVSRLQDDYFRDEQKRAKEDGPTNYGYGENIPSRGASTDIVETFARGGSDRTEMREVQDHQRPKSAPVVLVTGSPMLLGMKGGSPVMDLLGQLAKDLAKYKPVDTPHPRDVGDGTDIRKLQKLRKMTEEYEESVRMREATDPDTQSLRADLRNRDATRNVLQEREQYRAGGGSIFQQKGTDTVPAMLTPGEFVMKKSAVDKYGVGFMRGVNNGVQGFAKGGPVQYLRKGSNGAVAAGSGGGPFAGAGELVSSINNTLDAFNQAFTAFSGLSNLLDNIISSISNINITHTINLQGSLNIPGFSQEAVNSIVSTIADQTADITNKQIRKALRQRDSDDENKT